MRRHVAVSAVVCLGLWCLRQTPSLSAFQAPHYYYEIEDLGSIGGNFTLPADINDAGDVAGTVQTSTFEYHAFLYTDETGIRDLGTLNGTGWSQAFSINNRRHITGTFTRADGSVGAFLYGDDIGTIELGGHAGASSSSGRGLNDHDQVAGYSNLPDGSRAFLWTPAAGLRDLGTLNGGDSSAGGINRNGQVVGQAVAVNDPYFPVSHAFRYTEGVGMQDLGTLHRTNRSASSAVSINIDAEVVGYSHDPANVITRGFLYTDRDGMRDLGTLGGRHSWARDINDHGAVVGHAQLASGQQHAFLYTRRAGMIDLNALIDSTTGWTLWTAEAINNRGTIVGVATMGGRSRGYRARRIRDDSAPEIEVSVSPQPNAAGWNTSDVTVRWTARDPESGIESTSGCDTQTVTENTAGLTFTCSAVNPFGGSSSRSVTLMVDKSAPEIKALVSPLSNAAGWHTSDVTVSWTVHDPETGVVSTSGCNTQTLTEETAGGTVTCAAVNGAGGSSSQSVLVKIDRTPPVLNCIATPSTVWPPDGRMVPVSIAVNVADAFSGATGFTLESILISDPTASQQAVAGFTIGTSSTAGSVQALRSGTGTARVYSFTYTSVDRAGLAGSCTASVVVPHDERP